MKNIFVYGTLMYDEIWKSIVEGKYEKDIAIINGYERLNVKNEVYPALVERLSSSVKGVVRKNVSSSDIDRLNVFEGKYYKLTKNTALDQGRDIEVLLYLLDNKYSHIVEVTIWSESRLEKNNIDFFYEYLFWF